MLEKVSSSSRGFSLVELLLSTTLTLIIFSGVGSFMVALNRSFVTERPRLQAVENGQAAADTVVRLIRSSSSRPSHCTSTFIVPEITPSSPIFGPGSWYGKIRIRADWNPADCDINDVQEDVTISAAGNSLYLDAGQTSPFVGNISDIRFQFYDGSNTLMTSPTSSPADIAFVKFSVTTVASDGTTNTLTNAASIRK